MLAQLEDKSTQCHLPGSFLRWRCRDTHLLLPVTCPADIRDGRASSHATHSQGCKEGHFRRTGGLPACPKCWWHHATYGNLVQATVFLWTSTFPTTSTNKPGRLVRRRSWSTLVFPAIATPADEYHSQVCPTAASMGSGTIWSLQ